MCTNDSLTKAYLRWVRQVTGDKGTWQPNQVVPLGSVGYFDACGQFVNLHRTEDLTGVTTQTKITGRVNKSIHQDGKYSFIEAKAGAPVGVANVRLKRGTGFVLYVGKGEVEQLDNEEDILDQVKNLVAEGKWHLGWLIVGKRLTVNDGFSMLMRGRKAQANLLVSGAAVGAPTWGSFAAAGVTFNFGYGSVRGYRFSRGNTPTFDRVWRIQPSLRRSLYGDGPNGAPWESLTFRPNSRMSKQDVLSLPNSQLFDIT
ncbi:hypothetical protein [Streptomyces sp. 303MFCol5.2]|uniref:hypothetical protein n=1 Tax=Streptomyces sp. 303MFCol5.2 TaxID=1172181 RepID=UPI00131EF0A1|nr:hypothetical protein [Streptomyces sp. 303MFCol5.2]